MIDEGSSRKAREKAKMLSIVEREALKALESVWEGSYHSPSLRGSVDALAVLRRECVLGDCKQKKAKLSKQDRSH